MTAGTEALMKGSHLLLLSVLCAGLLVAGCANPTFYQPADPQFGYKEQQLESDRFRVTFAGNSLTGRETVENYLLYRAAEITKERGYDYFIVAGQDVEVETRYTYAFSAFPGYGHYRLYGFRRGAYVGIPGDGQSWPRTRYEAVANIVLFRGEPPMENVKAFDAREVLRFLEPEVQRPEEEITG